MYKFVCRVVIYGDQKKGGWNQWQWSKGISWLRHKLTSRSLVTDEDPLIGNVLRMTITVHCQLDLFKALGVDTIYELGMLSVEPTHTGRGMQTCLILVYRRNCVSLLTIRYLYLKVARHCLAVPSWAQQGPAIPAAAVYCVRDLIYCICNIPRTAISTSSSLCTVPRENRYISFFADYVEQ